MEWMEIGNVSCAVEERREHLASGKPREGNGVLGSRIRRNYMAVLPTHGRNRAQ